MRQTQHHSASLTRVYDCRRNFSANSLEEELEYILEGVESACIRDSLNFRHLLESKGVNRGHLL